VAGPVVLHVMRDWIRPSEAFVADVVSASTRTQPVVAFGHRGMSPVPPVPAYSLEWALTRDPRVLRLAVAAIALRRRASVLHAHFGYWAAHTEAVARRTRRPWSVSLHGHDLLVEGCPAARHADLVVVPSQFLADAASRAGIKDDRLLVIPSGLDLARHRFRLRGPVDGRPVVVTFAGRYVEKKGVLDVARALSGVGGIRARFVGHGPLEVDLRKVLAETGLEAELIDGSEPGAVHRAIDETDLLVTASKVADDGDAETLGLVNLEALACGVPVVTTASGGIPEAMPRSVPLVPEGDVGALREAVLALLTRPQDWAEIGRQGRAHVEGHFVLADRVAELEQQWLALAGRR
jgi:glycosyltransferase involved in cell wall biosynthesis